MMALSAVEAILSKARNASQEDVDHLCRNISELLAFPDKTPESCTLLRQLFVLLQASDVEPCFSKSLLTEMLKILRRTEGEKTLSKQCTLCSLILKELIVGDQQLADSLAPKTDQSPNKAFLSCYVLQGSKSNCLQEVLPAAVRWLSRKDFDSQCKALSFLVGVSCLHGVLKQEHIGETSEQLCTWLMNASLYQARNAYTINPFRKDEESQVTEIDGTPCRNFFTVLNIGQYYTDDQYLNIYSFSILYKWLHQCSQMDDDRSACSVREGNPREKSPAAEVEESPKRNTPAPGVDGSPKKRPSTPGVDGSPRRSPASEVGGSPKKRPSTPGVDGSPRRSPASEVGGSPKKRPSTPGVDGSSRGKPAAAGGEGSPRRSPASEVGGSPKKRPSTPGVDGSSRGKPAAAGGEGSPGRKSGSGRSSVVSRVLRSLVSRSVDYCFRVMDQCERKAKVPSDAELQVACLTEVVVILDLVCQLDTGQIPRVHQEMRRLYTRLSHDTAHSPTVLRILQFFLNHSATVVHDPQEVYNHFFGTVLSRQFRDPGLAFDTVVFMVNNLTTLCYTTNILSHFFPNILKILAWHPRTFMKEFLDLLPAMMAPTTAIEIFHTLLDLPCLTAALEVMDKAKRVEPASVSHGASVEPTSSVEAFHTPRFKPLFNFISRPEAGQGDTINRLSSLHTVLEDIKGNARVFCCSQLVPVMIRRWFNVILEEADEDFVTQILPAMLERSGLLFDLPECKADVVMILGEQLLQLVDRYPDTMVEHATDIIEFIHITNNMRGRQNFYGNLVYCIGEYCSSQHAQSCTPELIAQYFDVLEVVTYEICGNVLVAEEEVPTHPKILCHLMSAMAKLSTRRQDLIPRAILCLTKVAKQQFALTQDPLAQEALVSCAQEHVNLLKVPNFAVTVLNPPAEVYSGSWHRDGCSLPLILRGIKRIMTDNSG